MLSTSRAGLGARSTSRRARGTALLDALIFLLAFAAVLVLLVKTAVAKNAARAERAEARVEALEREVARGASRVARLRQEITALRSDPVYIERVLHRKVRALAPHKVPAAAPLPAPAPTPPAGVGLRPSGYGDSEPPARSP
jgi:cell division protein FtsB